jgi:sporulation protein YlmC with PRC-barrel domain
MSEVRAELLRGRRVVDSEGVRVGRIEEILAEEIDGECRILEFHLGHYGRLESIGALGSLGRALARLVASQSREAFAVRWDRIDLSDPDHPRLTCRRAELPRL